MSWRDGSLTITQFGEVTKLTDTDKDGRLSRWELLVSSLRLADDPLSAVASIAEFQLVHVLLAEDGGLRREPVRRFLNGDMVRGLLKARAAKTTMVLIVFSTKTKLTI